MTSTRRLLLLLAAACGVESPSDPAPQPEIGTVNVITNPENVLSVLVQAEVSGADSVAIRYGLALPDGGVDSSTPAVVMGEVVTELPVLGLLPDRTYKFEVIAYRGSVERRSPSTTLTTGSLPADLPSYGAEGSTPTPGYVLIAAGVYALAIDNTGRVVWYRRLSGPSLNFMAQPNGKFVARPSTPDTADVEPWVEFDPLGRVTRTLHCAGGLTSRPHDLIALADGSWWLLCDDTRVMDLRSLGGGEAARVTGTAVQHVGSANDLLFAWTPFSHFTLEDLDAQSLAAGSVNWTHGNALDLAPDGTVVVSFRNLSEITGIDARTGLVLWRLGGARNQFTFDGTPVPAFARQHGLRIVSGDMLLLDNLGNPAESRARRFRLDVARRAATLVAEFRPSIPVVAQLGGTTQSLQNGHTLVSFGSAGRVEEYDATGKTVWQILGNPGYVFRAQRIRSLYTPGVGDR